MFEKLLKYLECEWELVEKHEHPAAISTVVINEF